MVKNQTIKLLINFEQIMWFLHFFFAFILLKVFMPIIDKYINFDKLKEAIKADIKDVTENFKKVKREEGKKKEKEKEKEDEKEEEKEEDITGATFMCAKTQQQYLTRNGTTLKNPTELRNIFIQKEWEYILDKIEDSTGVFILPSLYEENYKKLEVSGFLCENSKGKTKDFIWYHHHRHRQSNPNTNPIHNPNIDNTSKTKTPILY